MNSRPVPEKNCRSAKSVGRLPAAMTIMSVSLLAASLMGFSGTAGATERYVATERFTEYAQVIDVQPVYREVRTLQPREECWTEEQQVIVGYEDTVRRGYSRESVRRSWKKRLSSGAKTGAGARRSLFSTSHLSRSTKGSGSARFKQRTLG